MKPTMICKISIDCLMTISVFVLMGFHITGNLAHEWIGTGMFLLFILHHVLNWKWYRNLFSGSYTPLRVLRTVLNVLLSIAMVGLMVSGVMLSSYVFSFLDIHGGLSFARRLHLVSSYWMFVLISMHLGFHWSMFLGLGRKILPLKAHDRIRSIVSRVVATCIAAYGAYAFFSQGIVSYMILRNEFVFWDFDQPALLYYLDYLGMMGFFLFLAYYTVVLIRRRPADGVRQRAKVIFSDHKELV